MTSDTALLREFARTNSEDAFAELVKRHVNLVYSAAFRQVNGDAHLAQDVAQTVFTDLAKKANSLSRRENLTGWLYTSAHFAAAKIVRGETRRRDREEKFMRESTNEAAEVGRVTPCAPETEWETLRPALDAAMHELKETDREAILLRYFENRPFSEVGPKLGLNENAARMRVDRAVEKLRVAFAKHGIATTSALAAAISANAVQVAPASLAATFATTSLAGAGTGAFTLLKIMTATQLKLGISALVVAGAATMFIHQQQTQTKLRAENVSLAQQVANLEADNQSRLKQTMQVKLTPRLPAPPMLIAAQTNAASAEDLQFTNLYSRFTNAVPKLTAAQVEAYLKANRTNAASLLAAYRTSGDTILLKEAMEKYPNNPQVAFEAVFDKDLSPEEQRQWLNAFEKSAPDNALANYLSAYNLFNSGQIDQGIQELMASAGKGVSDYTLERAQDDEEAYLSAGYSAAEAARISDSWLTLSQLSQIKHLGVDLVDLANAYSQSGDQTSAQATYEMAMNLGQRYENPSTDWTLISQLVGLAIQKIALSAMNPNSPYGDSGLTVQDQLNQNTQNRAAINELAQQATPLLPTLSDQDILNYENRRRAFGELAAFQWVVSKFGQHGQQ
jgi:RNA polymerase sigma factor (sigma-70 family)